MNNCICCHSSLLRQIQNSRVYSYCPTCRQNMPAATANAVTQSFEMVQRRLTRPESPDFYVPRLPALPVAT